MRSLPLGALVPLALVGCLGDRDAKVPGEELGTYQVSALLDQSTCGSSGVLAAPAVWDFTLRLSRDRRDLFWITAGNVVPGSIADDEVSFSFETRVEVPIVDADAGVLPCTVIRTDRASGTLQGRDTDVTGLTGILEYAYGVDPATDCSRVEGSDVLPCMNTYTFEATRTEEVD